MAEHMVWVEGGPFHGHRVDPGLGERWSFVVESYLWPRELFWYRLKDGVYVPDENQEPNP